MACWWWDKWYRDIGTHMNAQAHLRIVNDYSVGFLILFPNWQVHANEWQTNRIDLMWCSRKRESESARDMHSYSGIGEFEAESCWLAETHTRTRIGNSILNVHKTIVPYVICLAKDLRVQIFARIQFKHKFNDILYYLWRYWFCASQLNNLCALVCHTPVKCVYYIVGCAIRKFAWLKI